MTITEKEREQWTFHPRQPGEKVKNRLEQFEFINAFVSARGGWVTSLPGAVDVSIECLPGSTLPDELREGGAVVTINKATMTLPPYALREDGESRRILATAIVEKFVAGTTSELEPLTAESTRPVTSIVHHAGICRVLRYAFDLL